MSSETHPTRHDLLEARSHAISMLRFPDADATPDELARLRAWLRIIERLNVYINKETVKNGR